MCLSFLGSFWDEEGVLGLLDLSRGFYYVDCVELLWFEFL